MKIVGREPERTPAIDQDRVRVSGLGLEPLVASEWAAGGSHSAGRDEEARAARQLVLEASDLVVVMTSPCATESTSARRKSKVHSVGPRRCCRLPERCNLAELCFWMPGF